ncbi:MAG: UvrD-helicase domain-containing protein, partial [Muribaculaceae bacterium]|nr:UvrD-helicase domain-containing protein [Muribaculaceae bacterium]
MTNEGNLNVYRASAGSGKTFHLALTYITLLLGYKSESGRYHLFKADDMRRHREILAITFTNKATAEMRSRIIEELNLLANPAHKSDYLPHLRSLLGYKSDDTTPDNDIRQCARHALDSILFDLGEIQISTIDAFFQRVLRSFAYEADLAGNYELSLEDKQITEQAINELLALSCGYRSTVKPKNLNPEVLTRRLSNLITNQVMKGEEYKIFNSKSSLRSELVRFVNALSGEDYQTKGAKIEEFLAVPNAIEDFEEALKHQRSELYGQLLDFIGRTRSSAIGEYLYSALNNAFKLIEQGRLRDLSQANFSYFSPDFPNPEKLILAKGKKQYPEESARFFADLNGITGPFGRLCTIETMLANMKYYGLFHEVLKVRQALKVHLNTVMLSDTNTLLKKIIGDDTTPFIYERIGRRLQHFLIDEFQDTSRLQWLNLKPLLVESLSENHENLIIGDVKQCIYRFRNSDPQLLANELQTTSDIKNHFNPKSLASNWRSSKTIVEFNNLLFSEAGKVISANIDSDKADAYLNVAQKAEKSNLAGYVNIALNINEKTGPTVEPIARMVKH